MCLLYNKNAVSFLALGIRWVAVGVEVEYSSRSVKKKLTTLKCVELTIKLIYYQTKAHNTNF